MTYFDEFSTRVKIESSYTPYTGSESDERDVAKSFRGIWGKDRGRCRERQYYPEEILAINHCITYIGRRRLSAGLPEVSPTRSPSSRHLGARNAAFFAFRRWNKGSFFDQEIKKREREREKRVSRRFPASYRSSRLTRMVSPGQKLD